MTAPRPSPDQDEGPQRDLALLLDIWREACRHIRLADSIGRIAERLRDRLPLGRLLVRRVDPHRSSIETVAAAGSSKARRSPPARSALEPAELERVLVWLERGEVLRIGADAGGDAAVAGPLPRVLPDGVRSSALAIPLGGREGPPGLLLMLAEEGRTIDDRHASVFQQLAEPLTAALDNDRRLAELQALREAADAERRSLLTRLGGQSVAEAVIGADTGLREVVERAGLVAASDVPVLLLGETGSGKEVVARLIHRRSGRADGPFLRVNCGAIPPELVDSELFGHERGSFTGAESTRKGWFERADGGTLFLDEVGELSAAAQVRLLRVLQDGTFERVGGQDTLRVDVRVIAATHRDLQWMLTDGRFRRDLWYRIAVFPVHVPPLREHLEDVPALATHFALKAARRFGSPPLAPTPTDLALLRTYSWPGNVRELSSVMERAVILGLGRTLEIAKAIGITGQAGGGVEPAPVGAMRDDGRSDANLDASLNEATAKHIRAALRRCRGRIEGPFGAAKALEINPHTLRSRMRRLGIDWRLFRTNG